MAFTAGLKAPKKFTGNNQATNQNTFDRLVTVTDYDTAKGYMYAEDDKGKKYEIFVNPEETRRANDSLEKRSVDVAKINWMGHSIDEKMKKAVPVGSKVILLRSRVVQNDKTRDLSQTEVHRIVGVPSPEADKTFQGIFTMTYRVDEGRERVSRVQHWNPNGVDINDETALNQLKEQIDAARANYGTKIGEYSVAEPTIGIQFRALLKTDREYQWAVDPSKKSIYELVDTSLPFDWIPGPEDENGKEIKSQAHPITGDEMMDFAEKYVEYISNSPDFAEHLDNMKVEVCFYHVYPASKNDNLLLTTGDPAKDKNADKNPLHQLSHRLSYIDLAQTEQIMGRNAAVNGIIQISGNKLEKVNGKPVEIPNYWVNKIHANNTRGHVHAFIRTADGYKAEPNEALALIKTEQNTAKKQETPQQEQMPTASASTHVPSASQEDKGFDPFADNGDDPFAEAETQEPAKQPLRFGKK